MSAKVHMQNADVQAY